MCELPELEPMRIEAKTLLARLDSKLIVNLLNQTAFISKLVRGHVVVQLVTKTRLSGMDINLVRRKSAYCQRGK